MDELEREVDGYGGRVKENHFHSTSLCLCCAHKLAMRKVHRGSEGEL